MVDRNAGRLTANRVASGYEPNLIASTSTHSGELGVVVDLNSFLADPLGYVPGTKMSALDGIKAPERRAALIRYLRSLSDVPAPLPE